MEYDHFSTLNKYIFKFQLSPVEKYRNTLVAEGEFIESIYSEQTYSAEDIIIIFFFFYQVLWFPDLHDITEKLLYIETVRLS